MPTAPIPDEKIQQLAALYAEGRFAEVVAKGEALANQHPNSPLIWNVIGSAQMALRRFLPAERNFKKALALRPNYPDALNNLGLALKALDRRQEAVGFLKRAVDLKPNQVELVSNLGVIYGELGEREEALKCHTRAVELDPNYEFGFQNLAVVQQELGRRDEAIRSFTRVLAINPDNVRARALRYMELASLCDWDAMAPDLPRIASIGVTGEPMPPSLLINVDDNPERNRLRAERYAAVTFPAKSDEVRPPPSARPQRLRIGYFSADFHEHATMLLMARMFELHDRERFAVHAYSYGPQTGDPMRLRAKAAIETFRDVRSLTDPQIIDLAKQDQLDIAIDLKGNTTSARFEIFAERLAPIQIAYLGFPGTMGAQYIDYIVADKTIIPPAQRSNFTETPIYLPHSYQVNDDARPISTEPISRADAGLPENGFVFCCFNNSYKITSAEFDVWMRLLREVDGSVLWLLRANAGVEQNLRKEAAKRSVDPSRLVFADYQPPASHLARQKLADLFLDTFACNAHTTASDALWAGLPVLTKPGNGFAARVAASLLNAIGLPELITDSVGAYEALALALAREPARLAAIKQKLAANRLTAPLFNSALTTRHIEQAYDAAYQRYLEGKAPDVIKIPA